MFYKSQTELESVNLSVTWSILAAEEEPNQALQFRLFSSRPINPAIMSTGATPAKNPRLVLLFSGKRKSGKDYITDLLKVNIIEGGRGSHSDLSPRRR